MNNHVLEVNLTVFVAYLTFYTAESVCGVSGILAILSLGLYMTKTGKTKISSASEEAIHHIWQYIGFVAETMIFILTGIIVAIKIFREDTII